MRAIVVEDSKKKLALSGKNIQVKSLEDNILLETSIASIDTILVFGNPSVSTQLLKKLATEGKNVHYFSMSGHYLASVESFARDDFEKQRMQFLAVENKDFSLGLAKRIIYSKVELQKTLLYDYERKAFISRDEVEFFEKYLKGILEAKTIDQVRGFEGRAAKTYFYNLNFLLSHDFYMKDRNRRPPKDPFNSLLSLGYSIIMSFILGIIRKYGLNAGTGVLHEVKRKHATLASDLIEEWRVVIVDEVSLRCVRDKTILASEFKKDIHGGVYLEPKSRKKFIDAIKNRMLEKHIYFRSTGKAITAEYAISLQIESIMRAYSQQDYSLFSVLREKNA